MGFSCKSKAATAVTTSTHRHTTNNDLEIFRYKDLDAATNAFSQKNLLYTTRHGALFRAHLPDGRTVAVKRPHHDAAATAAFRSQAQILSKLFSRRLVNLLGYCSHDHHETLLVLEHMERGTVEENLRDLAWGERVRLAVDVAKAVRALHASSPRIVHCNLRSANVFLDHEGHARLGDFCLAKCSSSSLESIPEIAGEFDAGAADPKVDVFCFGVVLLELISGRVGGRDRLIDWALPLVKHGHHMALCDPRIVPFPADDEAVRVLANVAARCVRSVGTRRPSMDEVVQSLTRASKLVIAPDLTQTLALVATPVNVRSSAPWLVVKKKKKRALVFRLSRFLARKLRIGRSSYNKMHRASATGLVKSAEDRDQRERSVVEQVLQHKSLVIGGISGRDRKVVKSRSVPGSGELDGRRSTSGKKFVRLT